MSPTQRPDDYVALGRLQADMEEAKRQHTRLFDLVQQQTDILSDIREEMRRANDAAKARLDDIEPIVKELEALKQKGWGFLIAAIVVVSTLAGGISEGGKAVLKKLGVDM